MIYLKYTEPTWLAVFFFAFIALAAFIVIYLSGRPKNEEERRLMRIYRESYNKIKNDGNND